MLEGVQGDIEKIVKREHRRAKGATSGGSKRNMQHVADSATAALHLTRSQLAVGRGGLQEH